MPKSFPEPDWNQPTPGPDDLALEMNQLMVAAVMIVLYILLQIVLKKNLKVMMKVVHLLPFIKEQSIFIIVNHIFNSAFQTSITQTFKAHLP